MPNRIFAAVLSLALSVAAAHAQDRSAPTGMLGPAGAAGLGAVPLDDPRVPLMQEFLARVMSADRARVEAFLKEKGTPAYAGSELMASDITRVLPEKPTEFGVLGFLNAPRGHDILVLYTADGEQRALVLALEGDAPYRVARIRQPRVTSQ